MDENRLEFEQQQEIVLTYRPAPQAREVVLRCERELPPCMRPPEPPAPAGPAALASRSPWLQEIAPPEKAKKNRWGVRLFVGASLLIGLICLGVGIWYVDQYGWAAPGGAPDSDDHGPRPPEEYDEDYYHWDSELSDEAITIPSYPTGGDVRLSLTSSADRPALPGDLRPGHPLRRHCPGPADRVLRQRGHRRHLQLRRVHPHQLPRHCRLPLLLGADHRQLRRGRRV